MRLANKKALQADIPNSGRNLPLLDENRIDRFDRVLRSFGWTGRMGVPNPLMKNYNLVIEAAKAYRDIFEIAPSSNILREQGFWALDHAVKDNGGYGKLKKEIGIVEKKRPKKSDFTDPKEHVIKVVKDLMAELGHFPTKKEFFERKLWYVLDWAREDFGGMPGLRAAVGAKTKKKGSVDLKIWENFQKELISFKEQIGHEPTCTELRVMGRFDLLNGVGHFGGMIKVRKRLGWKILMEEDGELQRLRQWPHLEDELKRIIAKNNNRFPTHTHLCSIKKSRIHRAADAFGGLAACAIIMGYKPNYRARETSLRDWKNVKKELEGIEKTLGHPPSSNELETMKRSYLLGAILRHHGGMVETRKKMGWPLLVEREAMPANWIEFERYARSIIDIFGEIPNSRTLTELGYRRFEKSAVEFGGLDAVRMRMGFKALRRSGERSYRHWENVEAKISELTHLLGVYPTSDILALQGLEGAIKTYHGGYQEVKNRILGKTPKPKNNLLIDAERQLLFTRAKEGDNAAQGQIVDGFRRMIERMAHRINPSSSPSTSFSKDLYNDGVVALLRYLDICETPGRFYGGSYQFIRRTMLDATGGYTDGGRSVNGRLKSRQSAVRQTQRLLRNKLGRDPNVDETLKVLGMEEWEFAEILKSMARPLSFEDLLYTPARKTEKDEGRIEERWLKKTLLKKGKSETEATIIVEALCNGKKTKDISVRTGLSSRYIQAVIRGCLKNSILSANVRGSGTNKGML